MDHSRQLRSPHKVRLRRQTSSNGNKARRLGDVLSELMGNNISPRYARFGAVAELWGRLLPVELDRHCRLAEITGGQLKVLVDSPSHLHELRLCRADILTELQRHCPQARIRDIKFTIG